MKKFNSSKYRNFPLLRPDLILLFWSKIDRSGRTSESQAAMLAGRVKTPCHLWMGGDDGKGYGSFGWYIKGNRQEQRKCLVHVLAYYLVKNDLPQERGLELDHWCQVRNCCNPDHLEPVFHTTNVFRGNNTKISEGTIDLIKYLHNSCCGWTQQRIANFIGSCDSYISRIVRHKNRS